MTVHNHDIDPSCRETTIYGDTKGECLRPLHPLGVQKLTFERYLDRDDELEVTVECDCLCNTYLSRRDVEALRDHLNLLLAGSKPEPKPGEPGYALSREEAADFARRWDARVTGNLDAGN